LLAAAQAAVLLAFLGLQTARVPRAARFWVLLLAVPVFVSFKHGFVRPDSHVINYFCFIAVALALLSLEIDLKRVGVARVAVPVLLFFVIWLDIALGWGVVTLPSGVPSARMLWGALRPGSLERRLDAATDAFPESSRIEPELLSVIGGSPVASMSMNYTNLAAAHLRLRLYPVVQRYSAFTPYLDGLNAAWIREQGPRFLVFDGGSIDTRDPWAETPAMWLEVYRWYDARLLGPRNLLLERRATPRFRTMETIGRFRMAFTGTLRFPPSNGPVFWTMHCGYSSAGRIEKLLFHAPRVMMSVHEAGATTRQAHVIPEVLVSPVMGTYLPNSLSQFYAVFRPGVAPGYSVDQVRLESPSSWTFSPACEVELLRPGQ
jgi:hypothetical protein